MCLQHESIYQVDRASMTVKPYLSKKQYTRNCLSILGGFSVCIIYFVSTMCKCLVLLSNAQADFKVVFNYFSLQLGAIQIQVQFGDFEEGKYKFIE